jgi:uncharacterized coiled-coil protein SlyX
MGLLDQNNDIYERYIPLESKVAEMGPLDSATIDIPVDATLLEKIKAKDSDPHFVTVEIESGLSKNKLNWRPEMLRRIAEMVNTQRPVGYLGHIPQDDRGHSLPPPQTLWVGAKVANKNGKTILYIKGYNHTKEIRDYVDLGLVDAVSISGNSTQRPSMGGYEVIDFTLESIDWARKGKNAMPSRVVTVTAEMEGGTVVDGKDIAAISEAELRQHNPTLVELLASKDGAGLKDKVTEMEATIEKQKGFSDLVNEIATRLKVEPDKILENLDELISKMKGAKASDVKNYITQIIEKQVKTARGQKLVSRLVGEMEDITELTDDTKKEIEKRVTESIESDDDIKAIVGEMVDDKGAGTGGMIVGGSSRMKNDDDKNTVIDNDNLTVRKRTMA